MSALLEKALFYAETMGWSVFPLQTPIISDAGVKCSCRKGTECRDNDIGKHPRTQHGLKDATRDPHQIRAWWSKWPQANIGLATGAASGLVVIDIDPRNGGNETLAALVAKHGPMPATLKVITGSGGAHYYLKHPGAERGIRSGNGVLGTGIDVKGDGGYVVAPPSLHRCGQRWVWESATALTQVPLAEIPDWVLPLIECIKGPSNTPPLRHSIHSTNNTNSKAGTVNDMPPEVGDLLHRTLPTKPGTRREHLMLFARGLKFDLWYRDTPLDQLKPWVLAWHQIAWPRTSQTTPAEETWFDFCDFWESVKYPLNCDLAAEAKRIAESKPLPEAATRYSDPRMQLLVATCRELQQMVGDGPFSLSCYQVAKLFEVTPQQGHTWLHGVAREGVLQCVSRGKAGPGGVRGSASKWRYTGDVLAQTPLHDPEHGTAVPVCQGDFNAVGMSS
jgi:hypothetical protein